jgi:hypothetical protein
MPPSEVLWLPEGAVVDRHRSRSGAVENGRRRYADGSASLGFTFTGDREELSAALVRHFAAAGWRQRATQHRNPDVATSFADGWRHHCACILSRGPDGKLIQREPYFTWHGEWEDLPGNVVTYSLSGEGRMLHGDAAYVAGGW